MTEIMLYATIRTIEYRTTKVHLENYPEFKTIEEFKEWILTSCPQDVYNVLDLPWDVDNNEDVEVMEIDVI